MTSRDQGRRASLRRPVSLPGPDTAPDYNPSAMSVPPLPDLFLYGRPGCSLCDDARATIQALLTERRDAGLPSTTLIERDIDTDPAWHDAFFGTIPVVELGGRRLELVTGPAKVRTLRAKVLDAPAVSPDATTVAAIRP
jgi:hypothetical protein